MGRWVTGCQNSMRKKIMTQGFLSLLRNINNKLYDVTFSKSDLLLSNLPVLVEVHGGSGQDPYSVISEHKYFYTLFFFIINKSPLIHFTLNTCLFLSAFFFRLWIISIVSTSITIILLVLKVKTFGNKSFETWTVFFSKPPASICVILSRVQLVT